MLFAGWQPLLKTLIIGPLAYFSLVLLLRVSGKRTLSKMNAFDLVVTVALGSTLASILTSTQVSLTQGLLALGLLAGLQFMVAWLAVRWPWFRRLISSRPQLLLWRGRCLTGPMNQERLTQADLLSAIRKRGGTDLHDTYAVVLETDGALSVILQAPAHSEDCALADVNGFTG